MLTAAAAVAAAAKSLQLCPTLCSPIDGSPPGSAVPGLLQARTLGWVAIASSSSGNYTQLKGGQNFNLMINQGWIATGSS